VGRGGQAGTRTLNEGENTLWNPLILCNFGFHGGGGKRVALHLFLLVLNILFCIFVSLFVDLLCLFIFH